MCGEPLLSLRQGKEDDASLTVSMHFSAGYVPWSKHPNNPKHVVPGRRLIHLELKTVRIFYGIYFYNFRYDHFEKNAIDHATFLCHLAPGCQNSQLFGRNSLPSNVNPGFDKPPVYCWGYKKKQWRFITILGYILPLNNPRN